MSIFVDLSSRHEIVAANSHFYKTPTEERYIDRVLQYHDLIYLLDGSWAMTEDEEEYQLKRGDVLLLAAGRHHYTRLPCQSGTRTLCVHVTCTAEDRAGGPACLELPTHMHLSNDQKIRSYFEEIVSLHWAADDYKAQRLSALFDLLILELAAAVKKQTRDTAGLADRAIALLMENPHQRITAQEMAEQLFVSTKTLNNAMNRKTGMPFYAFEKNLKLDMIAQHLLTEPDARLSELASAFDFHDEFHMSKAFKQKFGVSPNQYRKDNI